MPKVICEQFREAIGIGKATTLAYARNGTRRLVLADLNESGVQKTALQAKQEATHDEFAVIALHADVRRYASVENVFETAVKKFGRIDYSVTTAGIFKTQGLLADNALDFYDDVQETNDKGILHHTKAAIRVMLEQEALVIQDVDRVHVIGRGAIVNVCSIAGLVAVPGNIEYVATKFAAVALPKQLRLVATAPESRTALSQGASLKRLGDVEEVADAILFLTSNVGNFVHGSTMTVDGGYANNGPM
ncbi:short chain dehydrogenase [Apiospora phragmitis]|uniref:Short chain dehydrogenase n=1 Tax=Apiospora phragmitis TaxID=2905665 RepID=A0ABR1VI48_9PEZI